MKPTTHLLSILLLTTFAAGNQLPLLAADAANGLLVKWKDGPKSHAAATGNAQIGSTVKRNFNALGWQLIELPAGMSVRDGIKTLQTLGTVSAVEPNGHEIVEPSPAPPPSSAIATRALALQSLTPNDSLYSSQWYLPRIGAPAAWSVTTGSSNIVVAVLDSGVNYLHPDLAPNMWRNPGETGVDDLGRDKATNGIDDDENGYLDDVHGADVVKGTGDPIDVGTWSSPAQPATNASYHGTFVAGVIGSVGNNGAGIAGVNWSVQIMAVRRFGGDASDPATFQASDGVTLAAWDYVLTMKRRGVNVRVINNSSGAMRESTALREAIATAGEEGILAVCSAGNSAVNSDVWSPRPSTYNLPSVISVAASTESDGLASFSNYGATTVDLAAPGVNITSTWKDSDYWTWQGTSFSAPLVAGGAALLLAVNPSLTVGQLKAALFGSVDQPVALRDKVLTNGRLNVDRALQYLTNASPPAIVITALPGGQRTATNAPIQVTFNRPMNRLSVEGSFIITPSVNGAFEWTDDGRSFLFRHDAPFDSTTNYTVRILGTAQDESGEMLDGDFDRIREGSPADDFVWTFRFLIPNDDFTNAQILTGASGSIQASNRYAFVEWTEPRRFFGNWQTYGASVWYRWTAPEGGGWLTFDLTRTTFDSLLILYTGDQLDRLVVVAGNDNFGSATNSRISFPAAAGANYSLVVASKSEFNPSLAGDFTLGWYPTPPPVVSNFTPTQAYPGQTVTLNGTNFTGVTRVLFNGVPAVFALSTNAAFSDLQLTAVVPFDATTGPITIETPHGNVTSTTPFTAVTAPALAIRPLPETNLLELSWVSTSGFNLQRADNLSATSSWTAATVVSARLTNGIRIVTVTNGAPNRFFRLYRP